MSTPDEPKAILEYLFARIDEFEKRLPSEDNAETLVIIKKMYSNE